MGFGGISLLGTLGYGITMMGRPMKKMGEIMYDLLTEHTASPDIKRCRRGILLQTQLIVRDSEKL